MTSRLALSYTKWNGNLAGEKRRSRPRSKPGLDVVAGFLTAPEGRGWDRRKQSRLDSKGPAIEDAFKSIHVAEIVPLAVAFDAIFGA